MVNKIIASVFGVGYLKSGAAGASALTCLFIWLWWHFSQHSNGWHLLTVTIIVLLLGIYVSNNVEPYWGHDSKRVVIDEVAGMLVTMLFIPANIYLLIAGFILFRLFDNIKPFYIKKMEKLPRGTGVMFDDILAGIYSNIVLWVGYSVWSILPFH